MNAEIAPSGSLADHILAEHRAALASAGDAVAHARRAGELLLKARGECDRGEWETWITENCAEISLRTVQRYMEVARGPQIGGDSLRDVLLKLAVHREPNKTTQRRFVRSEAQKVAKTAESSNTYVAAEGADEGPSASEIAEAEASEAEYQGSIDKVMAADDRLAAAHAEIKRQAAEIASLTLSRNSFMNGKAQVEKLLQTEQRKVASIGRKLDQAKAMVDELRAQLEQYETAPAGRLTAAQLVSVAEFILERSGIGEHDGERTRYDAETQAVQDAVARWPVLAAITMLTNGEVPGSDSTDLEWPPGESLPF